MIYTFTKEDVELVEKFIDIKRRGYYVDGGQLTEAYNRILHKSARPTNCGSCLRQRVQELEQALNAFKASIQVDKEPDGTTVEEEENKPTETIKKGKKKK